MLGYFLIGFLYLAGRAQSPWALVSISLWLEKLASVLEGVGTVEGCLSALRSLLSPLHAQPLGPMGTNPQVYLSLALCPVDGVCWFKVARGHSCRSQLGGKVGAQKPPLGPQSLPHGRIQLSPHAAAEGVHFPKPPLSLSKTRGCGEIATKQESSPLSRRRALRFTQSRPSACRYPWPRRARSPLWALFPPPEGTGMDATVPGSPQASTEGAKTRAQCGSLGPKPASRCTAPGPSAPWCYGGTS